PRARGEHHGAASRQGRQLGGVHDPLPPQLMVRRPLAATVGDGGRLLVVVPDELGELAQEVGVRDPAEVESFTFEADHSLRIPSRPNTTWPCAQDWSTDMIGMPREP